MANGHQEQRSINSNKKRKTRRGLSKHKIQNKFSVVGVNSNGISSKLKSLDHIISKINPSVICIQETKVRKVGRISVQSKDFVTFELVRKESGGGGLATMVRADLSPVWVSEGDDTTEVLVVEIHMEEKNIRIINAYGPQMCDSNEKKSKFWCRIQEEIREAAENHVGVILQMDGNLHAGSDIIRNDPNEINGNGKLFRELLRQNPSLWLVNGSEKCEGDITRKRVKGKKVEMAILDFLVVSEDLKSSLQKLKIDTDREYPLCSFLKGKQKNSDHFTLSATFDMKYRKRRPVRVEVFKFKSPEGMEKYKHILKTENRLSECLNNNDDVEKQVLSWYEEFNRILSRSFSKVRVTNKQKETEVSRLFQKRTTLIQKLKKDPGNIETLNEKDEIEEKLATIVGKENREKIFENFAKLDQSEGESFSQGIWDLKKKVFPKVHKAVPAAKRDITGRVITDPSGLKKLYQETFTHRLRFRPPKQSVSDLYELQENLVKKRLAVTSTTKSPEWTNVDVINVMKGLKKNKSRDPLGLVNELFLFENAGEDLIQSLTLMMNKVKRTQTIPALFRLRDVTPIYKNKGSRLDLDNDRGVFNGTVLNSILQKLIYRNIYDTVDQNLTDSNVGARKGRNIRNHSFIVNSVIHHENANKSRSKGINLLIGDYSKCFDSMSLPITTNDMYNAGVTDDNLNLLYNSDEQSDISVKTPFGKTERVPVMKTIPQGDVNAPFKCTTQVDSISESQHKALENHLYEYKNKVKLPPLGMVDDQLTIAKCGLGSALASAHINASTNIKKLQFGEHKTVKMHIGNKNNICTNNLIDTFHLESKKKKATSILDMVDVEGEKHCMETVTSWTYLGDVIQSNGKNDLNIKERVGKGLGNVKQITQMISDLCLGPYHYEASAVLRSSLLLSSLISNSESWVGLTKKQISDLESVDEELLRNIFSAHSKTPLELLYLETGSIPIRFILMSRRLNFLWYLLNQTENSLLSNFFNAQCEDPTRGDWVSQARSDLTRLNMDVSFREIKALSKDNFKELVRKHVRATAFEELKEMQKTHSKSRKLKYNELKMQSYLCANSGMTKKEMTFAFSARAQMLDVKHNFKLGKSNLSCSLGCDSLEDQEHILRCPVLREDDESEKINYTDIYSQDLKVMQVTQTLMRKFEKFTTIKATVHGQSTQTKSSADESEDLIDNVDSISIDDDIVDLSDL